jgi:hypothetical protein
MELVNYDDTEVKARTQAFNVTKLNDDNHFNDRAQTLLAPNTSAI